MRTTHSHDSRSLTPPAERRAEPASEEQKPRAHHSAAPSPAVSVAMRLLHRSSATQNRFMSAEERAYLEHRRYGCE